MNSESTRTLELKVKPEELAEIKSGVKNILYREIQDKTYNKYIFCYKYEPYAYASKCENGSIDDVLAYNGGVYPFVPIEYKYLKLVAGHSGKDESITVDVEKIEFEPGRDDNNKVFRFNWNKKDGVVPDDNGKYTFWFVIYTLGNIQSGN